MIANWEGINSNQTKGHSLNIRKNALFTQKIRLNHSDICSGRAFLPLLYIKGNSIAFIEGFKTVCIDCRMMNKHIRSVFLLNESEPFMVAKPLNSSIGHDNILLSKYFQNLKLEDGTKKNELSLQKKTAPPIEDRALLNK